MIKDYTTIPTYVQAIQLDNNNSLEILNFTDNSLIYDGTCWKFIDSSPDCATFKNGDYVYKTKSGKCFLMYKDEFEARFIEDRSMY